MNLDTPRLLEPLRGKTSTFLVDNRQANLALARIFLRETDAPCAVLDLDALYSSCADSIMKNIPEARLRSVQINVPEPGADIEPHLAALFADESGLVIVDSMNSLNHILSVGNRSSRSRKLAFIVSGLSYLARSSGRAVVFTMYRRERTLRSGGGISSADLSDVTISVGQRGDEVELRCERGSAWPRRVLSLCIT